MCLVAHRILNVVIRRGERVMAQWRMMSAKVANIITTSDSDEKLSSDKQDAVTHLSPSVSPGVSLVFIDKKSIDEGESDDENTGSASMQDATACNVTGETKQFGHPPNLHEQLELRCTTSLLQLLE